MNSSTKSGAGRYDLVIIGGTAPGLSVAISSLRSGIGLVRVIEPGTAVAFPELAAENGLDIGYGETVSSIEKVADDLVVNTNRLSYRTRAVLVALRSEDPDWIPPITPPASERVFVDELPEWLLDQDVLVIGHTDRAVELVALAAASSAGVVLAGGGLDPALLSPAGENMLRRLERERRATLLYRAMPDSIEIVDGFPMAYFEDRRTPDLQFDHVIIAAQRRTAAPETVGASPEALASPQLWFVGDDEIEGRNIANGTVVGERMAAACFPEVPLSAPATPLARRARTAGLMEELRHENYNAVITTFEPTHSDLWVLRVRPDHGDVSHIPGQYASLGLGFWEGRIDDAVDPGLDGRWHKLIRRSYSISNRIFDDHGYLADERSADELEFYIVLVPPTEDNVPALTPRLALKRPGDRIYLGPKVAGRYTLASVVDPESTVLLFSTGTGEAPHNAMLLELLRKGHSGPIVSAVSVRKWADLGYLEKHRTLERRYPNYTYMPMPTREEDVPKRYIQSLITDNWFETELGLSLDPARTSVFLCGNPAMIGIPEKGEDGEEHFPETVGVVQLLVERGFAVDRRQQPGNIHYEEYW
jgi:ferredoxin--NADP+ reductase